jgi:hypothetical protein
MSGPDDKWNKVQISTTSDSNATTTSTELLAGLNANYPITSSFVAVCSDGTFLFIGYYGS